MSLKDRVERIAEHLNPQPATLITVIISNYGGIEDPEAVLPPLFYLGKYATAMFLGGSEKERRRELKRLRASGQYDKPPPFTMQCIPSGGNGKAEDM